jgi:hypothetical protein
MILGVKEAGKSHLYRRALERKKLEPPAICVAIKVDHDVRLQAESTPQK